MKKLDNTTWKHEAKTDPQDRIEVEIGDSKQSKFFPQSKIMRWDNEVNYSIRLQDVDKRKKKRKKKQKDIVEYDQGNFKAEFYEGDNAHKFVWYLKSKPATNKVRFSIQSKNVDFYYQPALSLTKEEKKKGYTLDKNYNNNGETGHAVLDKKGNVQRFRPINVVGSYAVYHSTKGGVQEKGGMKYRTGKVGHIYRPKLIDAEGKEAWGELYIKNGKYKVTIPQEFLDKAVYPIKSNDTFGYGVVGGSTQQAGDDYIQGTDITYSPSEDGSLYNITCYLGNGGIAKFGIYDSNFDFVDGGTSDKDVSGLPQWVEQTSGISTDVFSNNSYYLTFWPDNGNVDISYDSLGYSYFYETLGYNGWPASLAPTITGDQTYSIYATYGPTFTETLTEAITAVDTNSNILGIKETFIDALSLSDTFDKLSSFAKSFSETLNLIDTFQKIRGVVKNFQETISLSDTYQKLLTFKKPLTETLSLTDIYKPVTNYAKSFTETFSLSDISDIVKKQILELTETLTLIEIRNVSYADGSTTYSDKNVTYGIDPNYGLLWKIRKALAETLSLVGTIDLASSFKKAWTETISLIDTLTLNLIGKNAIELMERVKLNDTLSPLTNFKETLSDAFSLTDVLETLTSYTKNLVESISLVDTVSTIKTYTIQLTETFNLNDIFSRVIGYIETLTETLNLNDIFQTAWKYAETLSETISLEDSVIPLRNVFVSLSDSLSLSDAFSSTVEFTKTLSETLGLNDLIDFARTWWRYVNENATTWTNKAKNSSAWTYISEKTSTWNFKDKN